MNTAKFKIIIPPQNVDDHPDYLKRISEGNAEAFCWLYKNYSRKVYDYVLLLSGSPADSEDIVQNVFMTLWTKRQHLRHVRHFNNYLIRAAKNHLVNMWRKQSTTGSCLKEYAWRTEGTTALNNCLYKECEQIVSSAVSHLPARQQQVYRLAREEGLSRQQISEALNIAPYTVKATLQIATKKMKEELQKQN